MLDTWVHASQAAVSDATFIPTAIMRFTSLSLGNLEGKLSLEDLGIQVSGIVTSGVVVVFAVMAHWHVRLLIESEEEVVNFGLSV